MKKVSHLLIAVLLPALLFSACSQSQDPVTAPSASPPPKDSALDTLKKAASAGDAKAQMDLVKRFDQGDGVPKNLTTAFEWLLKAAEGGNAAAMYEVANRLAKGQGVQRDAEKAKLWWKKAAECRR